MQRGLWRVLGLGSILWGQASVAGGVPPVGCEKLDQARASLDFEEVRVQARSCMHLQPEKAGRTVERWAEALLEERKFAQARALLEKWRHHGRFKGNQTDAWEGRLLLLDATYLSGEISKALLECEMMLKLELPLFVRARVEWIQALSSLYRSRSFDQAKRDETFWVRAKEQAKKTGHEHPAMMLVRLLLQLEDCRRQLGESSGSEEQVLDAFSASNACMVSVLSTVLSYVEDARRKEEDLQIPLDEARLPYLEDHVLKLVFERIQTNLESSTAFEASIPVKAPKQNPGERRLYQKEMTKELDHRRKTAFLAVQPACKRIKQKGPRERLSDSTRGALDGILLLICPSLT